MISPLRFLKRVYFKPTNQGSICAFSCKTSYLFCWRRKPRTIRDRLFAMSVLAESILDTFQFDTSLVWATTGPAQATARFELDSSRVEVAFRETAKNEWQVSYTVAATTIKPTMEWLSDSLLIICGVFLAVIEFLEVRQPERLLFDKEHQDLVELFEAYLNGSDTDLKHMGYGRRPAAQISSVAPFRVEKTTPSAWRYC